MNNVIEIFIHDIKHLKKYNNILLNDNEKILYQKLCDVVLNSIKKTIKKNEKIK